MSDGADLTGDMDRSHNQDAVPAVAASPSVPTELPAGWVPEDVVIRAFARRSARYGWETVIPEFSIAGIGKSFDDAMENAIELLDDYFTLCVRDGMSFAEARRPLPLTDMLRLLAEFNVGRVLGKMSFGDSGRRKLNLPLHNLAAHAH